MSQIEVNQIDSAHVLWFGHTNAWRELTQEKEDESLVKAIEEIEAENE